MASLHDCGWRQGFLVKASLTAQIHTVEDGVPQTKDVVHDLWLLAEQDCDLAQSDANDVEKSFELRAVREHGGDIPSGITGWRMRINGTECLHALDVTVRVSAAWLADNYGNAVAVDPDTRREVKTWLGFRYDRPAVPTQFVDVHKRIQNLAKSERAKREKNVAAKNWWRLDLGKVRDLLVGYEEAEGQGKVRAHLYAIAKAAPDVADIQAWVERIRDAVGKDEAFIIVTAEAMDPDNTPISLLETAFSVYGDSHSLAKATENGEDSGQGTAA